MSKRKIDDSDDEDFDAGGAPSADQFRRPLRQGEVIPPIPSIFEQLAMAAMTPMRPGKTASR